MVILVTGANGQLGNEMRLLAQGSTDEYVFADIVCPEDTETVQLDITDREAVGRLVTERGVDVVVNCAAYTNVDAAESDPERAALLNATAPGYLAEAMKERGGLLVHISTDYVFGGRQNTPYRETDPTGPTSVYGLTKLQGEEAVRKSGCQHVIVRTAWLYSEYGRNFLKTMLRLTAERESLRVVADQVGSPTYALDLARAIASILTDYSKQRPTLAQAVPYAKAGTYHYSGEGVCSWYDFAVAIAQASGHTHCRIEPCLSSEYPSPVSRPPYSVLDKTKIKETFGIEIPHWQEALDECTKKYERNCTGRR